MKYWPVSKKRSWVYQKKALKTCHLKQIELSNDGAPKNKIWSINFKYRLKSVDAVNIFCRFIIMVTFILGYANIELN